MDKLKDIKELKQLFEELLSITDKYGDSSIDNQRKIIEGIINTIVGTNITNSEKQFIQIQMDHKKLYPARGGLSEFYIWNDNFNERQKLNKPLSKIRERLWEILK